MKEVNLPQRRRDAEKGPSWNNQNNRLESNPPSSAFICGLKFLKLSASLRLCGVILFFALSLLAQAPSVEKVDPPSWWTGGTIKTVRVLARGTNLVGAKVESSTAGLTPSNPKTSANGHYLFFDLAVAESVQPGTYQLKVTSTGGTTNAAFSIFAALPRYGNYSGYSTDDVIYQLIPDRFANGDPADDDPAKSKGSFDRSKPQSYHGGDLQGVADKLAYIKSLGASALWMTPLYDNYDRPDASAYEGYGVTDFYSVDEHFGDVAKLKEFVRKAHLAGFVVIQDQIINHVGPGHAWANDPPTPTWFNGSPQDHLSDNGQRWTTMDPRATYQTQKRNLEGWVGNIMPDLNQKDPEVEKYLIQNSLWWLAQTGYDAIRVGEVANVPRSFLAKWTAAIARENSKVNILGDVPDADPALVSFFQGGKRGPDGVDTQITSLADAPLFNAVRDAFARGHAIRSISQVLSHDWLYPKPEALASFLGSSDAQRFMNEPGATTDGLKLAQTYLMTTRGTPIIYYGDELAMRGGNAQDFPGGFAGDAKNAFTPAGRSAEENDVWNYFAKLGSVRHDLEPLRRGSMLDLIDEDQQMAFARMTLKDAVVVVFNNDTKPADISFDISMVKLIAPNAILTDALGKLGDIKINNGIVMIKMPARTAAILAVKK